MTTRRQLAVSACAVLRAAPVGLAAALVAAALGGSSARVRADSFEITWYTIDGGGGTSGDGQPAGLTLRGTIGQPDAAVEPMTGGGFIITGGFWPPLSSLTTPIPGDADGDGDLDLLDYRAFVNCMSGPQIPPSPPPPQTAQRCLEIFDFDAEGDVDAGDFADFQVAFTG